MPIIGRRMSSYFSSGKGIRFPKRSFATPNTAQTAPKKSKGLLWKVPLGLFAGGVATITACTMTNCKFCVSLTDKVMKCVGINPSSLDEQSSASNKTKGLTTTTSLSPPPLEKGPVFPLPVVPVLVITTPVTPLPVAQPQNKGTNPKS